MRDIKMAGAEQKNHCTRGIRANITGVVIPRIPIDICGLRADMDSINKAQKTPASVPVIDMAALFSVTNIINASTNGCLDQFDKNFRRAGWTGYAGS